MGVAAYQRGTMLIRRQADAEAADACARIDRAEFRKLARDADRLQEGVNEMAKEFHYFCSARWWREARIARSRGMVYRQQRNAIIARLRALGFEVGT